MKETCTNCRFSHVVTFNVEDRIDAFTACREKPPEFIPPNGSMLKPVQHDGWCGKWVAKVTPRKQTTGPR